MTISLAFCEMPEKIREICAEKWRNAIGVKICKELAKSSKIDDILKIGAKACKIPQIQLHTSSCVDFQKC